MKKVSVVLFAVALAIDFSSFTAKVDTTFYYVYSNTSGDQFTKSNYTEQTSKPNTISGTGLLHWIKVVDHNDGSITQAEFHNAATAYDSNQNGTLNDESDIADSLDVKVNLLRF